MTKPRVLLADDHALIREGIRGLLESDYEVVGEAADGRELMRAAVELRPDVIVADIGMPNLNGLEAIRQLKKQKLPTKVIFLTMHAGVEFAVQAFRLGASGYVLKVDASDELVRAINEALKDRLYITPSIAKDVMTALMEKPQAAAEDEPEELLDQSVHGQYPSIKTFAVALKSPSRWGSLGHQFTG